MSLPPLCVYCRQRPVAPQWTPFCSERCKMADLGKWLSGDYRVGGPPAGGAGEPEDEPSGDDPNAH